MTDELKRLRKLLASIASIEIDWMVGLVSAEKAMTEISALLEKSTHDDD